MSEGKKKDIPSPEHSHFESCHQEETMGWLKGTLITQTALWTQCFKHLKIKVVTRLNLHSSLFEMSFVAHRASLSFISPCCFFFDD
jgi:hypothetical protein